MQAYRYLGVEVDETLSFTTQTTKAVISAKRGIGALVYHLRKTCPKEILSKAVSTFVIPALFYAIESWYPPNKMQQERLEQVQRFAARQILNEFSDRLSSETLLEKLKWHPIHRKVMEQRLILIRKYLEGKRFIPETVFSLELNINDNRHSQRLLEKRGTHELMLMEFKDIRNTKEDRLAAAHMRRLWNGLKVETVKLKFAAFVEAIRSEDFYDHICASGLLSFN
jgi:hypothetical protein